MIEEKLTALLKGVTPKVYPLLAPDNATPPFAIYSRVSTPRLRDLAGPQGIAQPTFRVDLYATGFLASRQLATQVRIALDGYSDDELLDVSLEQERDLSDLTAAPNLNRVQLEFRILHDETQPTRPASTGGEQQSFDLSDPASSGLIALL